MTSATGTVEHVGRVHDGVVDRFGADEIPTPQTVVTVVVVVVRAGASSAAGSFIAASSGFDDIDAGVSQHRVGSFVVRMPMVVGLQTALKFES